MQGFGERLRRRARELGFSDAELARRAGIESSKFGKYVRDVNEPDYPTLVHICAVLDVTPDYLLLAGEHDPPSERERLISLIVGTCRSLPDGELEIVAKMVAAAGRMTKAS
jgi:transcriptional regulator with XRE-family HTH domain